MSTQELLAEIRKLPLEEQQQLLADLSSDMTEQTPPPREPISEDEVERRLLAKGIISSIPSRLPDEEEEDYEPIEVEGQPLSETIIEERR